MKTKKILYYIFIGFIALIGFVLIFSVFPIAKYRIMVVQSGSMEPAIKTGSVVMTAPFKDYKKGDVITFGSIDKSVEPTTHRIYDLEVIEGKIYYITQGDANNAPDSRKVAENEVIGKMLFHIPYAGYLVASIRKPIGFILVLIIPALFIIFDQVGNILKEIKRLTNKESRIKN